MEKKKLPIQLTCDALTCDAFGVSEYISVGYEVISIVGHFISEWINYCWNW